MKPVQPIVKGFEHLEVVYAKDQPEYLPLPALPLNLGNLILTRWRLTWRERIRIFFHGDLYLQVHTFRNPLQPLLPSVTAPKVEATFNAPEVIQ